MVKNKSGSNKDEKSSLSKEKLETVKKSRRKARNISLDAELNDVNENAGKISANDNFIKVMPESSSRDESYAEII